MMETKRIRIFPMPNKLTEGNGSFFFGKELHLCIGGPFENKGFLELLPELFSGFTAEKCTLKIHRLSTPRGTACLVRNAVSDIPAASTTEEYAISVTPNAVTFAYCEDIGLIHAMMTLLQLISPWHKSTDGFDIPCCEIEDRPALAFRGMHLCAFPEYPFSFLRKAVRMCGLMKMTHVAIESFGTMKLDCLPSYGWDKTLTKEQLAILVKEGHAMGLEFIPFLNHFGHAAFARYRSGKHAVLDQAPELEELFEEGGWTWRLTNPEVPALLSEMRKELCEIFGEGSYFHIGCDEAFIEDGTRDGYDWEENDRFIDHVNSITADLKRHGRTPLMWGDMLLGKDEYPFPFCSNVSFQCLDYKRNLSRLNTDVIIDDWQYNVNADKPETVAYFLSKGIPAQRLILSPWEERDNIKGRCDLAKEHGLLGVLGTTWHHLRQNFYIIPYTACQAWSADPSYLERYTFDTLKGKTQQNQRKLLPCHGNYEEAGFTEKQIEFKIDLP